MNPLLVLLLIVVAVVINALAGESEFLTRSAKVGGLAFILYGFLLVALYLIDLAKH